MVLEVADRAGHLDAGVLGEDGVGRGPQRRLAHVERGEAAKVVGRGELVGSEVDIDGEVHSGTTVLRPPSTTTRERSATGSHAGSLSSGSDAMVTPPSVARVNKLLPHVVAAMARPSASSKLRRASKP